MCSNYPRSWNPPSDTTFNLIIFPKTISLQIQISFSFSLKLVPLWTFGTLFMSSFLKIEAMHNLIPQLLLCSPLWDLPFLTANVLVCQSVPLHIPIDIFWSQLSCSTVDYFHPLFFPFLINPLPLICKIWGKALTHLLPKGWIVKQWLCDWWWICDVFSLFINSHLQLCV